MDQGWGMQFWISLTNATGASWAYGPLHSSDNGPMDHLYLAGNSLILSAHSCLYVFPHSKVSSLESSHQFLAPIQFLSIRLVLLPTGHNAPRHSTTRCTNVSKNEMKREKGRNKAYPSAGDATPSQTASLTLVLPSSISHIWHKLLAPVLLPLSFTVAFSVPFMFSNPSR